MVVIIDYGILRGNQDQVTIKEMSIEAKNVIRILHFQSQYRMIPHGSDEYGINLDDGHTLYKQLETVISEMVADMTSLHLWRFKMRISESFARSPNYEFGRPWMPRSQKRKSRYNYVLHCHSYNDISCGARNAHSFYKWLMYHFQTKSYVKCPKNMTRHTAMFVLAI